MRVLVDTSAIIGRERRGVSLQEFDEWYVSAITIGELSLGVSMTVDPDERAIRRHTLVKVEDACFVRDVDETVARRFGEVVAATRRAGRRVTTTDALIAATALVDDIPIVTQDVDFLGFEGLDVILV